MSPLQVISKTRALTAPRFKWADLHIAALLHRRNRGSKTRITDYLEAMVNSHLTEDGSVADLDDQWETVYNLNIGESSKDRIRAEAVFQLLRFAHRTLRLDELIDALPHHTQGLSHAEIDESYILDILAANFVLKSQDGKIQFSHNSAVEYLLRRHKSVYSPAPCHRKAASMCLSAMLPVDDPSRSHTRNVAPGVLQYAYETWPWHYNNLDSQDIVTDEITAQLHKFLGNSGPGTAYGRYRAWEVRHKSKRWPTLQLFEAHNLTPLTIVCIWGWHCAAKYLLKRDSEPAIRSTSVGWYPIHIASAFGHTKVVQSLLDIAPECLHYRHAGTGLTPLHMAASWSRLEVVELLISSGADIHSTANNGASVLHLASSLSLEDPVGARSGQQPQNRYSFTGQSALLRMSVSPSSIAVIRELLRRGARIDREDSAGHQPFYYAAYGGHEEIGQILLHHGANITGFSTPHPASALTISILEGHASFVRFLLEQGVDVEERLQSGASPLHLAIWAAGHYARLYSKLVQVIEILLQYGADIEARAGFLEPWGLELGYAGETPLTMAVAWYNNDKRLIELLLYHGATLDAIDKYGRTLDDKLKVQIDEDSVQVHLPHGLRGRRPLPHWRGLLCYLQQKPHAKVIVPDLKTWAPRRGLDGADPAGLSRGWWEA